MLKALYAINNQTMTNFKDIKQGNNEFKIISISLALALCFYFLNKPHLHSEVTGTITYCSNFARKVGGGRFSKKLTIRHNTGELEVPYYKCDAGQKVNVIIEKRLITRQNVYTINYI